MRMVRLVMGIALGGVALSSGVAQAQTGAVWVMEQSGTTAGLRGIDSVDGRVAWASGTGGTVLRTVDGGEHWTRCATPDGDKDGAGLDFRGVQAWDAQTAIVMASGPGEKSRLYKTTDGCGTWRLVLKNPDKDGFWDAIVVERGMAFVVGDPVDGWFPIFSSTDGGLENWNLYGGSSRSWLQTLAHDSPPYKGEGLFAASNSAAAGSPSTGLAFVTGGPLGARFTYGILTERAFNGLTAFEFAKTAIPLAKGKSAGAFSFGCAGKLSNSPHQKCVAVGGDYRLVDSANGTAAYSYERGRRWKASKVPPHGYRSAVEWSEALRAWITVGTNGSDVSRDDGKTWEPLDDGNWNALSLPFVVGPGGRIARLNAAAVAVR